MNEQKKMNIIVNLCKSRGFVYQGSEMYGGLANTWDYGPLGVRLKNNIKNAWLKSFVLNHELNVPLDSAILTNPKIWKASGHIDAFSDPLIDCRRCRRRFRADKLIEENGGNANAMNQNEISTYIKENSIACPDCGECNFTEIRSFNLMFKTFQGVTEFNLNEIFLRPETAQGIFVNFPNILRSMRKKLPFGIGQIGKSFRNEITPGNFLFRVREFEQMELEFFCKPGSDGEWFEYWRTFCFDWIKSLGLKEENLRFRNHEKEEISHYSRSTTDIEFRFPFGWGELWGIANRGNFDLSRHQKFSGKSFEYFDSETNEKFIPYCIEPSLGLDRLFLAVLCDAYDDETDKNGETRTVLRFSPKIAPIKVCVMPLSKKLSKKAFEIHKNLSLEFSAEYDDIGSIGKRYRRQDEIGTPICITYDFESETDGKVTLRDRDTMCQKRIDVSSIRDHLICCLQ
jgi:glycyl-tRNA synthetase